MATAVRLRSEMFRNWTGSLSDLNSGGDVVDEYLNELFHFRYQNHTSWSTDHVDQSKEDVLKNLPFNDNSASALTGNQWLTIRYVLSLIRKKLRHRRVTTEQLKQLPWILFSSVIDKNEEKRRKHMEHLAGNHSGSFESTRSNLIGALCDANMEHLLRDYRTSSLLSQPKRRHCISESDLSWSLPSNQLLNIEDNEIRSAFSADFSESVKLRENLNTRHCGLENLTDSKLFGSPESTPDSLSVIDLETTSTDSVNTENDARSNESLLKDSPTSSTSIIGAAIVEATHVLDSTSVQQNPEYITQTNLNGISSTDEPALVESSVEPVVMRCTQAVPRSDSITSILSVSSSTPKLPKSVSFADEVGQALTEVFLIEENDNSRPLDYDDEYDGPMFPIVRKPKLQGSCFSDRFTRSRLKRSSEFETGDYTMSRPPPDTLSSTNPPNRNVAVPRYLWYLQFPQPASQYFQFRQRVENGSVSLENITVTQPAEQSTTQLPSLAGTIKVKNISFEKKVWLRLTTDNWHSYTDHMALYNHQLSSTQSSSRFDTFTFHVQVAPQLQTTEPCEKIEFAIRYLAGVNGSAGQYWDNNNGKNYTIERKISRYTWSSDSEQTNSPSYSVPLSENFTDFTTNVGHHFNPYTPDYRPNFAGITQFTNYRSWNHFAGETTYY